MPSTLLLNANWDLTLDSNGNIALAQEPYALAQDAASAIQTYLGEVDWDTTLGVPYQTQVFGQAPPISLLKQLLVNAALSASPDIATAVVFFSSFNPATRQLVGQVQVTSVFGGQPAVANFSTATPPGGVG